MPTVKQVAEYILARQDVDAGDTISNLKLQKLAYYAQGFCLAATGSPLFSEPIVAWEHGPVVPQLYHEYKSYGAGAIPAPDETLESISRFFNEDQLEILEEVCDVYGQFSAWKLRNFTHEESPWLEKYKRANNEISQESMKEYFVELLVDNGED